MAAKPVYIIGSSCLSPQPTYENNLLSLRLVHNELRLQCAEPDYKELAGNIIGRRMGKITKMGITAAKLALNQSGIAMPDAIITGTGLGCMVETEKFLLSVLENNEGLLNPTAFMQSTHNTLSGQIALMLGCKNYNFTYVHKGFSFESALLDSLLKIRSGEVKNTLTGGFDEITEYHFRITNRLGYWKDQPVSSDDLYNSNTPGGIAGEMAGFFALSSEPNADTATEIIGLKLFRKPRVESIKSRLEDFLSDLNLDASQVDLFVLGRNGDTTENHYYDAFENAIGNAPRIFYKHLCGENYVTTTFALWLIDRIFKEGEIPERLFPVNIRTKKPKYVLIYNHYKNSDHSFYLLRNCRNTD